MDVTTTSSNPDVVTPEQYRVAMRDPNHLKQWLKETHRDFIILRSEHLVDALPWPGGIQALMQIIEVYRDHRYTIPTGQTLKETNDVTGEIVDVEETHPEVLTDAEKRLLIKQLQSEIGEA